MQVEFAAEPPAGFVDHTVGPPHPEAVASAAVTPGSAALPHELRTNLVLVGFSLGVSVAVAVGLSLLMTLLG